MQSLIYRPSAPQPRGTEKRVYAKEQMEGHGAYFMVPLIRVSFASHPTFNAKFAGIKRIVVRSKIYI